MEEKKIRINQMRMLRDFFGIVSGEVSRGYFDDASFTCNFFAAICRTWEKQKEQRKESAEKGINHKK